MALLFSLWKREFHGYNSAHLRSDVIAGLTVAAVALPLALAFGVASGSTAAAGLVTAIIGGVVIGTLSGAPYQISGPTGAMSAVLIVIAQQFGLKGLWITGLLAGVIIFLLGLLKLGRIVNFLPAPVITGFTSGIALIIFIGQIDNLLGVKTATNDSAVGKAAGYFLHPLPPINMQSVYCGAIVAATMVLLPRFSKTARIPAALVGITLTTVIVTVFGWKVGVIGTIPKTIILKDRYIPTLADLTHISTYIVPAVAVAALGSIESLLAGSVAGRMTGVKLEADQELIAQGVGNIILPFFGGVPATAAIARMSVSIKSGGITRVVSLVHSLVLLAGVLFFGVFIGRIPMAALAGVLMVTAVRMNEWHSIRFYVSKRFKDAILIMLATMVATIALDLTRAILIGVVISVVTFVVQASRLEVVPTSVEWDRLRTAGHDVEHEHDGIRVVYVAGPLFFGAFGGFMNKIEAVGACRVLILSMRGVPMIDNSGLHAIEHIWHEQLKQGELLFLCGVQPQVRQMFDRAGLTASIGAEKFFWSGDQAIRVASDHLTDAEACEWREGRVLNDEADALAEEMPLGVVPVE